LEQRVIDAAEVVEPSSPLCIVADDRFFGDIEDAIEECPGQFAHPCEEIPLAVNPKRCAADLAERVIEEMCEEAFEDAADYVNGERELIAAFEAALEAFNAAQTANSWMPLTKKVFRIPKSESVHENATGEAGDAPDIHP
jgi:hypothetical protein